MTRTFPVLVAAGVLDPLDTRNSPHVMGQPFTTEGREYVRCACGLAIETYGLKHFVARCPVADIEADYAQQIEALTKRRDESIARWRQ